MADGHINSYYAATANDATRYPPLEGDHKAGVCVVGGGFSGIATALMLAERGYAVTLLEANRVGWGASGRNGGQLIAGMSGGAAIRRQLGEAGERLLREVHYRGNDVIEAWVEKYQINCDLKHGWIAAATRPRHMSELRQDYEQALAEGEAAHLELIEAPDVGRVLGTTMYHGGLLDRRSGHLHPLNLCLGEARAAAGLGVRIHEASSVVDLGGGSRPFAATARGRVEADAIVLAGSTYHAFRRGPLRGLALPTGSYIICTEPLDEATARAVSPQDLAVADTNVVLDYFRLTADRRMLFGGRCNYSNRDPKDLVASLRPRLIEIFPQLERARIDYAWGGRIDIVLNRVPAIGRLEPNVYFLEGYSGHGVNTTHIAAEIVADAIGGTMERLDLFESIRHLRLPVGQWAGNQLLALGMLYYRLRDLL